MLEKQYEWTPEELQNFLKNKKRKKDTEIITNKEEFIQKHIEICNATPCKKYDNDKPSWATHSLEYSKRKCAKNCWKKYIKTKKFQDALLNK